MNCGFEDVLVLDEIWHQIVGSHLPSPKQLGNILETYSVTRNPDAEAICDLAMHNYIEMRSSVTNPTYLLRKKLEGFLYKIFPSSVIPLYTMVSFTRIPYSQALARYNSQTRWFESGLWTWRALQLVGAGIFSYWALGKVPGARKIVMRAVLKPVHWMCCRRQ